MNKKIIGLIFGFIIIFLQFSIVPIAHAEIVPKCNTGPLINEEVDVKVIGAHYAKPCNFESAMELVNNVITFLVITIAAPLIALILCYAGILLLTSGGSSESITKAKKIFKNAIFGYIIALAAWLIIHTIFNVVNADKCLDWLGKKDPQCEV